MKNVKLAISGYAPVAAITDSCRESSSAQGSQGVLKVPGGFPIIIIVIVFSIAAAAAGWLVGWLAGWLAGCLTMFENA